MKITANINNAKTKIIKSFSLLSITYNPIPRNLGSSSSVINTIIQDKIFINYPLGQIVNDYQLFLNTIGSSVDMSVSWTSSNTSVATVNSVGYVSYVSDGTCSITATVNNQSKSISLNFQARNAFSDYTFSNYVSNSLAEYINTNITNKLNGQTNLSSNNKKNIFLIQDHINNNYVRNVNCWAYGYDLTPISPWNSTAGSLEGGVLLSPRHVLFCKHYQFYPEPNSTIKFINLNNEVITRTLTNILPIDPTIFYPDFTVGLLDSDVTTNNGVSTGISFAKILPNNWYSYLPTISSNRGPYNPIDTVPIMYTDQEEKCLITHWLNVSGGRPILQGAVPITPGHIDLHEQAILFDSGNPIFTIINNQFIILSVITGSISGSFVSSHISDINNAMNQLGGGYQLTPIDLSSFTAF